MVLSILVFGSLPFMAYHGEKGYREHEERMQRLQAQQAASGLAEPRDGASAPSSKSAP